MHKQISAHRLSNWPGWAQMQKEVCNMRVGSALAYAAAVHTGWAAADVDT